MQMNTQDLMYTLLEGNASIQDARDLLLATGHESAAVQDAINHALLNDDYIMRWTTAAFPRGANLFLSRKDAD